MPWVVAEAPPVSAPAESRPDFLLVGVRRAAGDHAAEARCVLLSGAAMAGGHRMGIYADASGGLPRESALCGCGIRRRRNAVLGGLLCEWVPCTQGCL